MSIRSCATCRIVPLLLIVLLLVPAAAPASDHPLLAESHGAKAPPEAAQWDPLIGDWEVQCEVRQEDGTWRDAGKAWWHWFYILDGFAVQDVWINPNYEERIGRPLKGTNLRIYDPEKKKWSLAWYDNVSQKLDRYEAVAAAGEIVMSQLGEGIFNRITFFNMKSDSFDWKAERSQDGGETWQEYFRLFGKRMK